MTTTPIDVDTHRQLPFDDRFIDRSVKIRHVTRL